jgi:hypothetical protein
MHARRHWLGRVFRHPRIEQRYAHRFEIRNVAGDDRQAVHHRGRSNQGVALCASIGDMKPRATLRHGRINGKNATLETGQNLIVDPRAEDGPLRHVLACNLERAQLDFEDGEKSLWPEFLQPRQQHCDLPSPVA